MVLMESKARIAEEICWQTRYNQQRRISGVLKDK